jgi:hypothetical protein
MPVGQFNPVRGPSMTRSGAVSPVAFFAYTVIAGGSVRPDPGTAKSRSSGKFTSFARSARSAGVRKSAESARDSWTDP